MEKGASEAEVDRLWCTYQRAKEQAKLDPCEETMRASYRALHAWKQAVMARHGGAP